MPQMADTHHKSRGTITAPLFLFLLCHIHSIARIYLFGRFVYQINGFGTIFEIAMQLALLIIKGAIARPSIECFRNIFTFYRQYYPAVRGIVNPSSLYPIGYRFGMHLLISVG